jgi:protein-S-isoprenylcysteine O-methyltransferase
MALNPNGMPSARTDPRDNGQWILPDLETKSKEAFRVIPKGETTLPRALYPGGNRSLSGIALRAFLLGGGAALGVVLSVFLVLYHSHLWRPCFFVSILCVFHFLEFWTTAEYNTTGAFVSSFLLSNGSRYRQAHTIAFLEALITSYFFPEWQTRINSPSIIALGMVMIVVGQVVRTMAMAQAGTNFNHQVQSRKNEGHELVSTGLYAYLRHPSYFGFFWWGLGTQVVLGNSISLVAYALVLWYFFKTRIARMLSSYSASQIKG